MNDISKLSISVLFQICILSVSCRQETSLPKPHAYPRIVFPTGSVRLVSETYCPIQFEFPDYGIIQKQESFFNEKPADPCWFTIQIPGLNSSIHCSYGPIDSKNKFQDYIDDSYKILSKQNIKAEYREEIPIKTDLATGMAFSIDGPVATPYQFYLTDSTHHFFRAALYFNSKVNADSTRPVLEFIRKDLEQMQKTFAWKKRN